MSGAGVSSVGCCCCFIHRRVNQHRRLSMVSICVVICYFVLFSRTSREGREGVTTYSGFCFSILLEILLRCVLCVFTQRREPGG